MSQALDRNSPSAPPQLVAVSDGVYAYLQPDGSWYLNNTGFLLTARGVISIDTTSTERRTRAYQQAIAEVTDRPVRTVINTHHHGDHTYGNYLFPGATILAYERTRAEVLAGGLPANFGLFTDVDWGAVELEPPFVTYRDGVTVWADDLRCEVRHVGTPAHTTNDSIVWIPERSILFCGDLLFNGGTPFLLMGSVAGAVDVLETVIRPLNAQTIVAGHGPVAGPELIDQVLGYLHFLTDVAARGHAAGLNPLAAARETDLGPYAGLTDPERIVGNLHRAYAELDGGPRGEQIDVLGALRDMVAYNGGRPLTCHA